MSSSQSIKPLIVGLTGSAGSGKSLFAGFVKVLGASVIDVDSIGRNVIVKNRDLRIALQSTFGDEIVDGQGRLERRLLAKRAFSSASNREKLNNLVWPVMLKKLKVEIQSLVKSTTQPMILVDMAVLFEAKAQALFDHIVLICAEEKQRTKWLSISRAWSNSEIQQRFLAQLPDEIKAREADTVIQNAGDTQALRMKAEQWYAHVLSIYTGMS